ncbi:fungal protein [Schizosaccharomyces cryophilus OY26]|uniref:Fungal protein n=1 Tax=Schizosaccharomyces cryophilus (strain OY26 / ATCC MYA-4695 / CBS 11777 / NBRC 106824 / NRRL Y48691) TaxID=653667 RepID=S9VR81_SCHCR|nr:uncharacterized protein SPOG_01210 [Schizosaccharomyces cryophilus OY26]EPY50453.1 fungal protein [Schizosaccharomyces cryophilus OY26]
MEGMHMNSTGDIPIEYDFENYANHMNKYLWAHIICMIIAYVFILPTGIVLAMAKSKAHIPVQVTYVLLTLVGYIFAHLSHHHASHTDYYKGNIHRPVGRVFMWMTFLIAVFGIVTAFLKRKLLKGYVPKEPVNSSPVDGGRTLHSMKNSMSYDAPLLENEDTQEDLETLDEGTSRRNKNQTFLFTNMKNLIGGKGKGVFLTVLSYTHKTLGHLWLYMGFFEVCTGIVLLAGIFKGSHVFNGLAHWIKGGLFLWYGILSFGEYLGAFAEYGWAWNLRPKISQSGLARFIPSKEMVESSILFTYGISNVWLEHLGNTDGIWNHHDMQHVSIAFMLWWAGLCGMLVESKVVRRFLNTSLSYALHQSPHEEGSPASDESSSVSLNLFPAITVFFTGVMMSSHEQKSQISTVIHVLWGRLLSAAAVSRACTYILLYVKRPSSPWPTRPPTEIVTSFCLICGGIMFMASSYDVVNKIRVNDLSAMLLMNMCVALTCIIMGLELFYLGLKGYAHAKQN